MTVKTLDGWKGGLSDYLDIGDLVDDDLLEHVRGSVPPIESKGFLQMGEAYSHNAQGATFLSFYENIYLGPLNDVRKHPELAIEKITSLRNEIQAQNTPEPPVQPQSIEQIIEGNAQRFDDSGLTVNWDSAQEWVEIKGDDVDIFLSDDEASKMIDSARELYESSGKITLGDAMKSLAYPIAENTEPYSSPNP